MSLFSREKTKSKKRPQFVDVHSHVSFPEYDHDRGYSLERMRYAKVHTITVGVDLESSKEALASAKQNAEVYASVGLHPADNKEESFNPEDYKELVKDVEVVAVGECGLDYYRIKPTDKKEKERQMLEFAKQIEFAIRMDLPLMLHVRPQKGTMDAYQDVLEALEFYKKEHGEKLRGNVHFFVGNRSVAKRFVDLGFTLSFTGVLTFANEYDDVVRETPLDMILSETDSPYASPVPFRGERNEPVHVQAVVRRIAEIKGLEFEDVRAQLVENAYRVFQLEN